MKQAKISNTRLTEKRIEQYCESMEEILTKIHNRINAKKLKSQRTKKSRTKHCLFPIKP